MNNGRKINENCLKNEVVSVSPDDTGVFGFEPGCHQKGPDCSVPRRNELHFLKTWDLCYFSERRCMLARHLLGGQRRCQDDNDSI